MRTECRHSSGLAAKAFAPASCFPSSLRRVTFSQNRKICEKVRLLHSPLHVLLHPSPEPVKRRGQTGFRLAQSIRINARLLGEQIELYFRFGAGRPHRNPPCVSQLEHRHSLLWQDISFGILNSTRREVLKRHNSRAIHFRRRRRLVRLSETTNLLGPLGTFKG